MDLEEIKKLLDKEDNAKIILIEEGEPAIVISRINTEKQKKIDFKKEKSVEKKEINQSTELISKEEMPLDELRVEDLPF